MDRRSAHKTLAVAPVVDAGAAATTAYTAQQYIIDIEAAGVGIHWRYKPKGTLMYQMTGVDWEAWHTARAKAYYAGIDDMDVWRAVRDAVS